MLCAIAGAAIVVAAATPAAPTPAVLMNFLRCIILVLPWLPLWPPSTAQHWHAKLTLKSASVAQSL
jgi:hypothetical protein